MGARPGGARKRSVGFFTPLLGTTSSDLPLVLFTVLERLLLLFVSC